MKDSIKMLPLPIAIQEYQTADVPESRANNPQLDYHEEMTERIDKLTEQMNKITENIEKLTERVDK